MSAWLRFLDRANLWTDLPEDLPISIKSAFGILLDVCAVKGKGASYWKIDDVSEHGMRRAIAAYITTQSQFKNVTVVVLPEPEAKRLKVKLVRSDSANADRELGKHAHFDLTVETIEQAMELAEVVRGSFQPFSRQRVEEHVRWSVGAGHIALGAIPKELLATMAKEDMLRLK